MDKELFFLSPDNKLMAAEVTTNAAFKVGIPSPLFDAPISSFSETLTLWARDVTPDGKRFLVNTTSAEARSVPVTVVLNWQAGLPE